MHASAQDYLTILQALLPTGAAWPRDEEATLTKFLTGFADSLARVHNRCVDLIDEADPRTTVELIAEWERVCGLPDDCAPAAGATLAERRAAVVAKIAARGGQSRAFFADLAGRLGYEIEINEFRPFICGRSRCGERLHGGAACRFYWRVRVPGPRVAPFRCGVSRTGERLGLIRRAEDLECLFRRLAPAHSVLIFAYEGV